MVVEARKRFPPVNRLFPLNALLSDRSVEDAAVIVMFDPPLNDTPLIVRGVWRREAVPAFPETEPVIRDEKTLFPLNALLSDRSVEEAAVIVMFDPPLNETPLMVRGVWRRDAVPAFPETEPVIRDEKMLFPEKVLLSARSVVDAPLLQAMELAESTPAAVN
jgi:hypothetical protein